MPWECEDMNYLCHLGCGAPAGMRLDEHRTNEVGPEFMHGQAVHHPVQSVWPILSLAVALRQFSEEGTL